MSTIREIFLVLALLLLLPAALVLPLASGQEGKTIILSVRSTTSEPTVTLRTPDGVFLAADDRGSAATGSLLAVKLPMSGRYTVWISSRRGAGEYTARLIDGD